MFASLVSLVAGVSIALAPCPAYLPDHVSCYDPGTRMIWVAEQDQVGRELDETVGHEYGHADDFDRLTPGLRSKLKRIMHFPSRQGWWHETKYRQSPGEEYADNFEYCALHMALRIPKICAMLPRPRPPPILW